MIRIYGAQISRVALLLGVLIALLGGCSGDDEQRRYTHNLSDLEAAFDEASVEYVRQTKGPLRVGTDDPQGCEELYSQDDRMTATVCRGRDDGLMLIRVLPKDGSDAPRFSSATALLAYLEAGNGEPRRESVLVVDDANVTLTYVGRDVERVRALDHAIRILRGE